MKKTYIFDFDGTLVDSMPYWSESMLNILNEFEIDYPKDIIKIITPLGTKGTANYYKDVLGVPLTFEEMNARFEEQAIPKYLYEIEIKSGVKTYLEYLKSMGCSVNVLTASPHKTLDPCLKRVGIYDLFDNIWSCDDFGLSKSNPQIYIEALNLLGSSLDDTVFFDDNIDALKTAKDAGLTVVGVYDSSSEDFTEKIKLISDYYIKSFSDLETLID